MQDLKNKASAPRPQGQYAGGGYGQQGYGQQYQQYPQQGYGGYPQQQYYPQQGGMMGGPMMGGGGMYGRPQRQGMGAGSAVSVFQISRWAPTLWQMLSRGLTNRPCSVSEVVC